MPQPSITDINLKIICLQFHSNRTGDNKLKYITYCITKTELMAAWWINNPRRQQHWNWSILSGIFRPGHGRESLSDACVPQINYHQLYFLCLYQHETGSATVTCGRHNWEIKKLWFCVISRGSYNLYTTQIAINVDPMVLAIWGSLYPAFRPSILLALFCFHETKNAVYMMCFIRIYFSDSFGWHQVYYINSMCITQIVIVITVFTGWR